MSKTKQSNSKYKVEQVKSQASRPYDQGKTLVALGLGRIGKVSYLTENDSVKGMLFKVKHLVKVEEL